MSRPQVERVAVPPDAVPVRQIGFDPLGPTVRPLRVRGRTVHVLDEGAPDWPALLFLGGAGTTARAFGLTEFARTLRQQLRIRVVSVERNGLGQTPYDPTLGPDEYAALVWEVLDRLGVDEVAVVAVSGGGPYAARAVAARPERVRSLHLACAYAEAGCGRLAVDLDAVAADPVRWWALPPDSPLREVPGFVDATIEEATRSVFARGRDAGADGLRHAFEVYDATPLPDLSGVVAPAFLYWGERDEVVGREHLERWRHALPHVRAVRLYAGEAHDVQYRHWDQILCDVAHLGARTVMTDGVATYLVPAEEEPALLAAGWGLGLAAWVGR